MGQCAAGRPDELKIRELDEEQARWEEGGQGGDGGSHGLDRDEAPSIGP